MPFPVLIVFFAQEIRQRPWHPVRVVSWLLPFLTDAVAPWRFFHPIDSFVLIRHFSMAVTELLAWILLCNVDLKNRRDPVEQRKKEQRLPPLRQPELGSRDWP